MKINNIIKNRLFLSAVLGLAIFLLITLFSPFFHVVNETIRNTSIAFKNESYKQDSEKHFIHPELVFVQIDEATLERYGFPMTRANYVNIIENLNQAGAEVIGFDIIFANESSFDPEGDAEFATAIKNAGNVVLGAAIIADDESPSGFVVERPLESFARAAYALGYFQPVLDPSTKAVKSFVPLATMPDSAGETADYKHFSVALVQSYFSKLYGEDYREFHAATKEAFEIRPDTFIPYKNAGSNQVHINFIPKPSTNEGKISYFPSYSFIDIYENRFDPAAISGKIVLVGATAKGLKDTFTTPNGIEYGVYVLGNAVNTMLTKNFLLDFPEHYEKALLLLLLIVSLYFNLSRSGYVLIFSNLAIASIFLVIFPVFVLLYSSYTLNFVFELFLGLLLSLAVGNIVKYLLENKNKIKLSKALSEYVSKAIASEIQFGRGDIDLNGEEKELAIFFSDIEGFTTISEKFSPKKLVAFLRIYLEEMSNILLDVDGFINKYEGDAIMGLWGTFSEQPRKMFLACEAALAQQHRLRELNENVWSKEGLPPIKARIGLHAGTAIVGNIGAKGRKMEYTALGDSVNLASRLEGVNKFYGTYICASEVVRDATKDEFAFRFLDDIRVKGKDSSVKIYELLCKTGELDDGQKRKIDRFEQAYSLYKQGEIETALPLFEGLVKEGDAPSVTFVTRCETLLSEGLPEDWDGVWSFDKK